MKIKPKRMERQMAMRAKMLSADGSLVDAPVADRAAAKTATNPYGLLEDWSSGPEVEAAYGPMLAKVREGLVGVLDDAQATALKIQNDVGLNGLGKGQRLQSLMKTKAQAMDFIIVGKRPQLQADLEEAQRGMATKLPSPAEFAKTEGWDSTLTGLRLQVTWECLRKMTSLEVEAELKSAAESGDLELLVAVEAAPPILKLAREDTIVTCRQRYLELHDGEGYKRVETVKSAITHVEANLTTALTFLANICNQPVSLLEDLATKGQFDNIDKALNEPPKV